MTARIPGYVAFEGVDKVSARKFGSVRLSHAFRALVQDKFLAMIVKLLGTYECRLPRPMRIRPATRS